jgi:hypothetical protein
MLRNHPAHRHADDMRPRDAQIVKQGHAVGRHVGERVSAPHREAQQRLHEHPFEIGDTGRVEARRQADVAVVVPDGPKTARIQRIDKFVGPQRQLSAQPHHQQNHRRIAWPLVFEGDADPVYRCLLCRHAVAAPRWSNRHCAAARGAVKRAPVGESETGPASSEPRHAGCAGRRARATEGRAAPHARKTAAQRSPAKGR